MLIKLPLKIQMFWIGNTQEHSDKIITWMDASPILKIMKRYYFGIGWMRNCGLVGDKDNDGQWDYLERLQVMDSEIERKMTNTKANLQLFYEFSNNSELSIGHEHYFQSGYQPFDSGLNFIDYTMGSLWSKLTRKDFLQEFTG